MEAPEDNTGSAFYRMVWTPDASVTAGSSRLMDMYFVYMINEPNYGGHGAIRVKATYTGDFVHNYELAHIITGWLNP